MDATILSRYWNSVINHRNLSERLKNLIQEQLGAVFGGVVEDVIGRV